MGRHQVLPALEPGTARRIMPLAVAVLLLPMVHPVLRPVVGVPSHLLWFVHVLAVALIGYACGLRLGLVTVVVSVGWVAAGERLFGESYGVPADWATVVAMSTSVGFINLLVLGFAWWVREGELGRRAVESVAALALEEAPEATLVLDNHRVITIANAAAARLLSRDQPSLIGTSFDTLFADRRDPAAWLGSAEVVVRRPDGGMLPVNRHVTAVGGGWLVTLQDTTARLREEQGKRRTLVLAEMGQVLAGVAHELNNPLASLSAFAELLELDDGIPARERETVAAMRHEATRAGRIARRLLHIVRDRDPERVVQPVDGVVRRALRNQMASLAAHEVHLDADVPPGLPDVAVDAGEIEQILVNLIGNAHFAVAATEGASQVAVRVAHGMGRVTITVADDGPGIPLSDAERVFEPFFTTKGEKGNGLGLAIARRIARAHGGDLTLATSEWGGAAFALTLPVATSDGSSGPLVVPIPRAGNGRRALVIDDESGLRDSLRRVLEHFGWAAETVKSEVEAAAAMCEAWDVVLCDLRLGDGDGRRVHADAVTRFPQLRGRFVFMTGDALGPESSAFLDESGEVWISKPFEISDLLQRLDAVSLRDSLVEDPVR